MNEPIIQVTDFRKTYGRNVAVDGITFQVQRGEIFGCSALTAPARPALECLEGLRRPNAGSLRISGSTRP